MLYSPVARGISCCQWRINPLWSSTHPRTPLFPVSKRHPLIACGVRAGFC
ncbi:MAG: hypothetical protein SPF39_00985 [Prevotella sp.]|nr:hypothetical protein [Prevotella sp.]